MVSDTKRSLITAVESYYFATYVTKDYMDRAFDITLESLTNLFDPTMGVKRVIWSKNLKIQPAILKRPPLCQPGSGPAAGGRRRGGGRDQASPAVLRLPEHRAPRQSIDRAGCQSGHHRGAKTVRDYASTSARIAPPLRRSRAGGDTLQRSEHQCSRNQQLAEVRSSCRGFSRRFRRHAINDRPSERIGRLVSFPAAW